MLGQAYDTNAWDFTTDYFQCFDIPLTNGANTITLYATDSAGNLTVTNFTFRLDYASMTNPPVVGLGWPQDGTRIGSDSFTWRGWLNDPTVQVLAQIVSTNGVTNSVIGRIGRNGDFWVENLPMAGGVNALTLSATDVFGNSFSTNITVVKSDVVLTVEAAALGQAAGGLISDTNYTIWVNGLQATNNGDGTWSAPHPHLTLNTTVVYVQALSPSASFGNGATANNYSSAPGLEAEVVLPWPDGVIYQKMTAHDYTDISIYGYSPYSWFPQFIVTNTTKTTDSLSWREESGGTGSYKYERIPTQQPNQNDLLTWVGGSYPEFGDGTRVLLPGTNQTLIAPPVTYGGSYFGSTDLTGAQGLIQLNRSQEVEFTLLTGDKPESTSGELYQISGGAQETIYTSQYIGVESMNKKPEAGRVAGCV